jgi:hypothetical protein
MEILQWTTGLIDENCCFSSIGRKRRRTVLGGNETTRRASSAGGLFVPGRCCLELCSFLRPRGWGQTGIRPYTLRSLYPSAEVCS